MNIEPEDLPPAPDTTSPANSTASSLSSRQIVLGVIRELAETVIFALVLVFLLQLGIRNFRVEGHSMDPNLHHGQYLVVDKLSYRLPFGLHPPRRGDVVIFVPPTAPNKDFVKRVIGLPGETVALRDGQVFINGEPLPNTFGARLDHASMAALTIPENALFVLGDNRANSNDSRSWGVLSQEKVIGKALISYWPPETWGIITNNRPTAETTLKHWLNNFMFLRYMREN